MLITTNKTHRWSKYLTTLQGTIHFNGIGEALVSEEIGSKLILDSSYFTNELKKLESKEIKEININEEEPEMVSSSIPNTNIISEEKGLNKEEAIVLLNKSTISELQEMAKVAKLLEADWKKLKKSELVLFLFDKIKF